jgi:hypothetical protein
VMRKILRALLVVVGLVVAGVAVRYLTTSPSSDRDWVPDQSRMATITFVGDTIRIEGMRDADPKTRAPAWVDRTYSLSALDSAWLVVAPFTEKFRGPAHTFVTFGFTDGTFLSVSVEGRFEKGETYGILTGALRKFEIIYVVGTEHDLIGRRVMESQGPVYLYPVRSTPEMLQRYLVGMLSHADSLRTHPEFYNTFTNNCTSSVLAYLDPRVKNELPTGYLTVMPGYSDEVAERLGLLGGSGGIDEIRARYRINERGQAAIDSSDFSERIRTPAGPVPPGA